MTRLVVSLVFLGIYLIFWLIKKAGQPNQPTMTGGSNPLPSLDQMRQGVRPQPLALPPGDKLLLSGQTAYRELDEAMIIAAFTRTEGPPHGEPEVAVWRRGTVEIRYTFDAATARRELTFSGEGWEAARQQVAGKVTWLRG